MSEAEGRESNVGSKLSVESLVLDIGLYILLCVFTHFDSSLSNTTLHHHSYLID